MYWLYSVILHSLVLNSRQTALLPLQLLLQFDVIHFLIGEHHLNPYTIYTLTCSDDIHTLIDTQLCIHIDINIHKETDRQTDRHTNFNVGSISQ